jgi:pre-mRNA cleavage complex 2 protein Pcf11
MSDIDPDPVESYRTALANLTFNSRPLINMLRMLAEDNELIAVKIVQVIDEQIEKVLI